MTDPSAIQRHYSRPDLADRIFRALRETGRDPDALTRDDLAALEEFHIRGREATRELGAMLGLREGETLLDIGCGIGGPARTFAAEFGCRVQGIDLVEEFVRTASLLTERVGLAGRASFQQGDALDLPFAPASFDAAVLEHVNMNVSDKQRLFAEAARVLRPDGRLGVFEICAGPGGEPHFPVPWADRPAISFLVPPEELRSAAVSAGFEFREWRDVSAPSLLWFRESVKQLDALAAGSPLPGLGLLMGPPAREKSSNMVRNLDEDRIRVIQAVLVRP